MKTGFSYLFEWEDGEFAFSEGETPPDEGVEVDLPIGTALVEGIRSVRNLALFRQRLPFDDWIFEAIPGVEGPPGGGVTIRFAAPFTCPPPMLDPCTVRVWVAVSSRPER